MPRVRTNVAAHTFPHNRVTDNTMYHRHRFLQVKFHSHLNSMEESLIATRKEKAEVEALTRQLETGKTKAALELQVRQYLCRAFIHRCPK